MGQDILAYLPREVIINILSRLPSRTIFRCRCVCKLWLSLTETHEFIKSYFHNSSFLGCLALLLDETRSKPLKILGFIDEGNSVHPCRVVLSISFPTPHHDLRIHSSANGLLFLFNRKKSPHFICNPITREYIKLPPPKVVSFYLDTFGFGASKLTGQYKVVRMLRDRYKHPFKCEVYTVGTGSWRSIAADVPLMYEWISLGVFLNGNLYWLAHDWGRILLCFDLEKERFSTFSTPLHGNGGWRSLCALGDCLYLCQNSFDGIVIWLMNENGDDKSWRRECVIKLKFYDKLHRSVVPIKIFRDGDIWFAGEFCPKLYCYSRRTRTIREITGTEFVGINCNRVVSYAPSFFPLKTFEMENVISL